MNELKDKVVALTGAGSGIGRSLALNLAQEGCHLALADVNKEALAENAKELSKYNIKVTTHVVDVSKRDQVYKFAEDVMKDHERVDIVINNAGVTLTETIEDAKYEDYEWVVQINFWGVVYGTKAFIPYLKKQKQAHIVNISSISGLVGMPIQGIYCATKFAVKGFTETLKLEMMGSSVNVSCVYPGGVKTDIIRSARFYKDLDSVPGKPDHSAGAQRFDENYGVSTSDSAAKTIIKGIKKNKQRILVGRDARFVDRSQRLFPVAHPRLIGWYYKYYNKIVSKLFR